MSAARGSELERSAKDRVVTRVFDAPVGLVYQAWTEPRHVVHWWKPQGFARPHVLAWDDFCDDNDDKFFHKAFVTVSFEELGKRKTRVTLRARLEGVPGRNPRWTLEFMENGWTGGWKDNLEHLAGQLATMGATA